MTYKLGKKHAAALVALALGAGSVALAHGGGPFGPFGGGKFDKAELLEKFDKNKDGKLDESERAEARAAMKQKRMEKRKALLEQFDENKDGKLDEAERAKVRAAKAAERFKSLDTNGDGVLSQEEFAAGMGKAMGRRGQKHRF